MEKAYHIVIMSAIVFLCIGALILGIKVYQVLNTFNQVTLEAEQQLLKFNDTLDVINRPRTGTLAGINEVVFETKGVLDHTNIILDHEERQLTKLDNQENILFNNINTNSNNLNTLLINLSETTNQTTIDLSSLNDAAKKLPSNLDNLNSVLIETHNRISDPQAIQIINSLTDTMKQVDGISTDFKKISDNFEQKVDNPKTSTLDKIKAAWDFTWKALMILK